MSDSVHKTAMAELPDAVARLCGQERETFLLAHHMEAARRLNRLFNRAQLQQRVTMSYDPARVGTSRGSGQTDLSDSAAEARQRLARLASGLPGDCWGVLIDICVYDKGLQQIEQERNWPRRSAKLVLRIGLEQLARGWGLLAQAEGKATGHTQSWLPERPPMFADMAD